MTKNWLLLALAAASAANTTAQAALHDRGGGLIYDDVLTITWLQDASYAKTSGYDADGGMNWTQATTWAANLVYHDSVRNVDYSDWRLPYMVDTCPSAYCFAYSGANYGFNVQTYDSGTGTVYSELAYMYYVNLGLKGYYNPDGSIRTDWGVFGNGTYTGSRQNNVGLINNLQDNPYWSGSEDAQYPGYAGVFGMPDGSQYSSEKSWAWQVWAVRPGDVVPEPETYTLLLAGLGLVGWHVRRRG